MKQVRLKERLQNAFAAFYDEKFNENDFSHQQISVFQNESALENPTNSRKEEFLDKFLSGIKLFFLYVPGAMLLHLVAMFIKVFIVFGASLPKLFPELIGAALIGTFLTMLGIGKLSDLRYLKVPALILALSFLLSLIHSAVWIFDDGKSEGLFWLISFPIAIVWGYVVKRFLDKE